MLEPKKKEKYQSVGIFLIIFLVGLIIFSVNFTGLGSVTYSKYSEETISKADEPEKITEAETASTVPPWPASLNKEEYDERLLALSYYVPPQPIVATSTNPDGTIATTTKIVTDLVYASSSNVTVRNKTWPANAPYPHGKAILPFNRILAYYGNFYSTRMGILGEYEPEEVIARLRATQKEWEVADPNTPVLLAIEYIAMVAQADAGSDGMYRAIMPDTEIEKGYKMAQQIDAIYILDIQIGKSTIQKELPKFKKYLERPEVHLAIDPEFSMKSGDKPGDVIGTFDSTDVNYVIDYLADIVRDKQLPPKVLVVHRFTDNMVTRAGFIKPRPEVQVVMNMDGWGPKDLKRGTYDRVILNEPVQFSGVKIFYKNDLKPPSAGLLAPAEVLTLNPKPIYIQYQ